MLNLKKGASIISIALCMVAIALVASALVVANNNHNEYMMAKNSKVNDSVEKSAYVKIYTKEDVENVARQAFVDNYLMYFDGDIGISGLEKIVIEEVSKQIPGNVLSNYVIEITPDEVIVDIK